MLNPDICEKARRTKDSRFDGKFFVAVKTTKIYCRPICPATSPNQENILYFSSAIEAANAGYRPCLRCHPDSAPHSYTWKGVSTTLEKAMRLINEGSLQNQSLKELSDRLGISDRYLRQLFNQHLGVSPKSYSLYQQCLFAKKLLHQTQLPIIQVALASGFNSVRRFNDCFRSQLNLTPSQIRKSKTQKSKALSLQLYYRPPYHFENIHNFFRHRIISGLEWYDQQSYGRTFEWQGCVGYFTAQHIGYKNKFEVNIELNQLSHLKHIVSNIRRILDLDVDIQAVEQDLQSCFKNKKLIKKGVRLPGTWSMFEAGIRAILGQQVSVSAAHHLVTILVSELGIELGAELNSTHVKKRLFPTPYAILNSNLQFLKIPTSRRQTLKNLACHYLNSINPNDPQQWLALKGIGPWTVGYAQMRGLSDPDIYLADDLGIKKASVNLINNFHPEKASPWGSYLTCQLWSQL